MEQMYNSFAQGGPIRDFLKNYVKAKISRNYKDRVVASEKAMLDAWRNSGVATDFIIQSKNNPNYEKDAIEEAGPLQNSFLLSRKD